MALTRVMKKKYMDKAGNECPYCGSDHIEGGRPQTDSNCAWQEVICQDCEKRWNDVYTLTDIEEI